MNAQIWMFWNLEAWKEIISKTTKNTIIKN